LEEHQDQLIVCIFDEFVKYNLYTHLLSEY